VREERERRERGEREIKERGERGEREERERDKRERRERRERVDRHTYIYIERDLGANYHKKYICRSLPGNLLLAWLCLKKIKMIQNDLGNLGRLVQFRN
jgi:hypothetical protein